MFQPLLVTAADVADLSDPSTRDWLRKALGEHLVLVVRGSAHMSPDRLVALGSCFGEVQASLPIDTPHDQDKRVQILERSPAHPLGTRTPSSNYWHTDRSFLIEPIKVTILKAVAIADSGGETQFANTRMAYERLESDIRKSLSSRLAIHSYSRYYHHLQPNEFTIEEREAARRRHVDVTHPLVTFDPFSGDPELYLSQLCIDGIEGVPKARSAELVGQLHDVATDPTGVYSHRWRRDDIVIWNNSGLMHRGLRSDGYRRLERVVIT
jgi:alpha-ketoglutarate-dependent taurine dioxygenase